MPEPPKRNNTLSQTHPSLACPSPRSSSLPYTTPTALAASNTRIACLTAYIQRLDAHRALTGSRIEHPSLGRMPVCFSVSVGLRFGYQDGEIHPFADRDGDRAEEVIDVIKWDDIPLDDEEADMWERAGKPHGKRRKQSTTKLPKVSHTRGLPKVTEPRLQVTKTFRSHASTSTSLFQHPTHSHSRIKPRTSMSQPNPFDTREPRSPTSSISKTSSARDLEPSPESQLPPSPTSLKKMPNASQQGEETGNGFQSRESLARSSTRTTEDASSLEEPAQLARVASWRKVKGGLEGQRSLGEMQEFGLSDDAIIMDPESQRSRPSHHSQPSFINVATSTQRALPHPNHSLSSSTKMFPRKPRRSESSRGSSSPRQPSQLSGKKRRLEFDVGDQTEDRTSPEKEPLGLGDATDNDEDDIMPPPPQLKTYPSRSGLLSSGPTAPLSRQQTLLSQFDQDEVDDVTRFLVGEEGLGRESQMFS